MKKTRETLIPRRMCGVQRGPGDRGKGRRMGMGMVGGAGLGVGFRL